MKKYEVCIYERLGGIGFSREENNYARAIKYAKEAVAELYRNASYASIYEDGQLVARIENKHGKAVLTFSVGGANK